MILCFYKTLGKGKQWLGFLAYQAAVRSCSSFALIQQLIKCPVSLSPCWSHFSPSAQAEPFGTEGTRGRGCQEILFSSLHFSYLERQRHGGLCWWHWCHPAPAWLLGRIFASLLALRHGTEGAGVGLGCVPRSVTSLSLLCDIPGVRAGCCPAATATGADLSLDPQARDCLCLPAFNLQFDVLGRARCQFS